MLKGPEQDAPSLQSLSALVDGELDAAAAALACAQWRGDAEARASWHAYQLIGDVMRSDELASDATRDARFLRGVTERLAAEPVVLAPFTEAGNVATAGRAGSNRPRRWVTPAAIAAGVMAVASVLVVTRVDSPVADAGGLLAGLFAGEDTAVAVAPAARVEADAQSEPETLLADGQLVRDARLDRYFAAHKQFGGSSALGAPSGFLRAATTQTPGR